MPELSTEALAKCIEIAYTNFERRRSYEWKLCLAIWTALAAFIGIILKCDVAITIFPVGFVLSIVAIIIIVTQLFFLINVTHANRLDKNRAFLCEDKFDEIAAIDASTLKNEVTTYQNRFLWFKGYWSVVSQVAITIILILCATAILLIGHKPNKAGQTGKYQLSSKPNRVYIMDTATSQLWERNLRNKTIIDHGTNQSLIKSQNP